AGLQRVLDAADRTLGQRYLALLTPACRWLALELLRRDMEARASRKWRAGNREAYRSQAYNMLGTLHQASAVPPHVETFLALAETSFRNAIEHCPTWYQPYENLASLYRM